MKLLLEFESEEDMERFIADEIENFDGDINWNVVEEVHTFNSEELH